jgi:hypothetical protein
MRSLVISSKSSPRLLKKAKNFLLKNWVQRWEAGLVVHLVNTALASFLVSSEEKCLVVSIPRLSRAISARTWGRDPLVLTAFFFSEPLSSLPSVGSVYAQCSGISLVAPGAGGAAGGGGGGATIDSKEFLKFQADQQKFAAQLLKSTCGPAVPRT